MVNDHRFSFLKTFSSVHVSLPRARQGGMEVVGPGITKCCLLCGDSASQAAPQSPLLGLTNLSLLLFPPK